MFSEFFLKYLIHLIFSSFIQSLFVQVGVFFGGLAIAKDEQVLKNNCPHIVVGTPGRILALIRSKKLPLKNLKHFVLDECDKMLEQLGKFKTNYLHAYKVSMLVLPMTRVGISTLE